MIDQPNPTMHSTGPSERDFISFERVRRDLTQIVANHVADKSPGRMVKAILDYALDPSAAPKESEQG